MSADWLFEEVKLFVKEEVELLLSRICFVVGFLRIRLNWGGGKKRFGNKQSFILQESYIVLYLPAIWVARLGRSCMGLLKNREATSEFFGLPYGFCCQRATANLPKSKEMWRSSFQ